MEILDIIDFLKQKQGKTLDYSKTTIDLINQLYSYIGYLRCDTQKQRQLLLPPVEIWVVEDKDINALVTKIKEEYCILVNNGIINEHEQYLNGFNWKDIPGISDVDQYIHDIIRYSFGFMVFHEYAHVICGHVDSRLDNAIQKQASEMEADQVAVDCMINIILFSTKVEEYTSELEKLFFSIYFSFSDMDRNEWREEYNDKKLYNYYDEDMKAKRTHPLSFQRIFYIYQMFNVIVLNGKGLKTLPIRENLIEKLMILKKLDLKGIPNKASDLPIINESIEKIDEEVKKIRDTIPRITYEESAVKDPLQI